MANEKDSVKSLNIRYKAIFASTKKTRIKILKSQDQIDLEFSKLFYDEYKNVIVTDRNILALDILKPVKNYFKDSTKKTQGKTEYELFIKGRHALVVVPAGEEYKSIDTVLAIVKSGLELSLSRKDTFIAIGGGVLTDITAFAASIYKRGAQVEFFSTTMLGMCDAAIGGKTGCDFDDFKNITGTFYPARRLIIYLDFVKHLSEKEYLSGLGEVIKTALLFDPKLYEMLKNEKDRVLKRDTETLYKIVSRCVKAKARIVQKDLTEKNQRMLLNFGHTFGHALESRAGLGKLSHGECVIWGISRALKLSSTLNLCSKNYYEEVCSLLNSYGYNTDAVHKAFPDSKEILNTMKNDKKNSGDRIRLILQNALCENIILEIPDEKILTALTD
ncbi:MAG: 3-dehydroquinate synthase [Treponema sp.]|uniref:3-dehydroquinate synthase n=1 Tax=Treponema sp. TaxID=166 RepID=UPI00298E653E|nr:3-dehydroquinate synthase family protein [Treponema sp.]MBR5932907.1 3-dehydroquinate synthase [Treponema sp.]